MGRKRYKQRENRINKWNDRFFDTLTPDSGYVLGFFIADGALTDSDKRRAYTIRFIQKDVAVLERIAKAINFSGNIYQYEGRSACLHLSSRHASELLIHGYNIPPGKRKSYEVRIPKQVMDNVKILPHFIRGYFDGDGSIPEHGCTVEFVSGSPQMLDDCVEVLMKYAGLPRSEKVLRDGSPDGFKKANGEHGKAYQLWWTGTPRIRKFAEFIYGPALDVYGSDLYIRKKKDRFLINYDALYKDGDWLKTEFVEKGRSKKDIADEFGVTSAVIGRWTSSYSLIPEIREYDWMYQAYVVEGKGYGTIAKELRSSATSVRYWIKKLGICRGNV